MIENGMNLMKEDDDNGIETALEIHQIHNVIRTSNRRSMIAPPPHISVTELRRNSTTSSISGVSAMIVNGCDINVSSNGTNGENGNFAHPPSRPFNVRPIQIKTEPIDPDYDDTTISQQSNTVQSSPSNSSGSISIMTVNSSNASNGSRPKSPPMIVINGTISKSPEKSSTKTKNVTDTPSSPTLRARPPVRKVNEKTNETSKVKINKSKEKENAKPRNQIRDLRSIKRAPNQVEAKRKLKEAALQVINKRVKNVRGTVKKVEAKKKSQQKRRLEVVHDKKKQPIKKGRPVNKSDNVRRGVRGGGNKGRQRK